MQDFSGRPFKSKNVIVLQSNDSELINRVLEALSAEVSSELPLMMISDTTKAYEKCESDFSNLKLTSDVALATVTFLDTENNTNHTLMLGTRDELNKLFLEAEDIKYTYIQEADSIEYLKKTIPLLKQSKPKQIGNTLGMSRADKKEDTKQNAQEMLSMLIKGLCQMSGTSSDELFKPCNTVNMSLDTMYTLAEKGEEPHTLGALTIDGFKVFGGNKLLIGITDFSLFDVKQCTDEQLNKDIMAKHKDKPIEVSKGRNGINTLIEYYIMESFDKVQNESNVTLAIASKLLDDLVDGKLDSIIQKHKLMRAQSNDSKH